MRFFFFIATIVSLISIPLYSAIGVSGQDNRFEFTLGQPTITADGTSTCSNETTARFDFTLGQPTIVHDSTATCTAAGGGTRRILRAQ